MYKHSQHPQVKKTSQKIHRRCVIFTTNCHNAQYRVVVLTILDPEGDEIPYVVSVEHQKGRDAMNRPQWQSIHSTRHCSVENKHWLADLLFFFASLCLNAGEIIDMEPDETWIELPTET